MMIGDELKAHLDALRSAIPELKGVLLASNEGLPIAHSLSNGGNANHVATIAASLSRLGRRISHSLSAGAFNGVSIQAEEGVLFLYAAGAKAVLAVSGPCLGNAGLIGELL
jgi:predicted regulator of Ras-like GTPase activity (Roadblock/LC7/MglB family)